MNQTYGKFFKRVNEIKYLCWWWSIVQSIQDRKHIWFSKCPNFKEKVGEFWFGILVWEDLLAKVFTIQEIGHEIVVMPCKYEKEKTIPYYEGLSGRNALLKVGKLGERLCSIADFSSWISANTHFQLRLGNCRRKYCVQNVNERTASVGIRDLSRKIFRRVNICSTFSARGHTSKFSLLHFFGRQQTRLSCAPFHPNSYPQRKPFWNYELYFYTNTFWVKVLDGKEDEPT